MNPATVQILTAAHPELLAIDRQYLGGLLMLSPEAVLGSGQANEPTLIISGGTAFVPVFGFMTQRSSLLTRLLGGTSMEALQRSLRRAANNPDVKRIVLDLDSGGGSVFGVMETAALIREIRKTKRVIAFVNSLAASAAYWLASAASEIVITPSGQAGSVGVLVLHADYSRANEQAGVKPTYIFSGEYKVEGNPDEPLQDEAKAYIQRIIDSVYRDFVNEVAVGRGMPARDVRSDFGQGRLLRAGKAVSVGMADRIGTIDTLLARTATRLDRAKAEVVELEQSIAYRRRAH